jgi:predicted phosphoadenosine phosphosulfate sulfurtransferase
MTNAKGIWPKNYLGMDVFEAAVNRMVEIYRGGHRVVVSMSGGKDSTASFEVCRIAARATNRLPIEVVMRDDEIMYPGTFEYLERVADDPDVDFTWLVTNWSDGNCYNRGMPFYWAFDPDRPDEWVRPMSPRSIKSVWPYMHQMTNRVRYPPPAGKKLYAVIGIRAAESLMRMRSIYAAGGHATAERNGVINVKPIYDWTDRDIWRAIREFGWDYNRAYDYMAALGVPKQRQRVAPPTGLVVSAGALLKFSSTHPDWFMRVERRMGPGLTKYRETGSGSGIFRPEKSETWEKTFWRECVDDAPHWIAVRSSQQASRVLSEHAIHSTAPFPEEGRCPGCSVAEGASWRSLANIMYSGDLGGGTSLGPVLPQTIFMPDKPWANELKKRTIPAFPKPGDRL